MHRAAVLTISDRVAGGEPTSRGHRGPDDRSSDGDDASGDLLVARLADLPAVVVERRVVPDEAGEIADAVRALSAVSDLLVSTGGTGLGARDVTPEAVAPLLERTVPGMVEAMRAAGLRATPMAMLSRQVVGIRDGCLVVALPGSPRAVAESLDAIWVALPHALQLLAGDTDHG
ncbi:MAG: molybdenum cofactor biosynthesis protein B [Candidatus Dormibacteria bacterium]